eukprot:CAMPEP_0202503000 /NCGR_PEP_ID=MMETSP1361-20130828/40613_1 /ASSEMBLY_ACC=CAM_ASM_000849 /TAXON_ID=210615 /ORGANISM="Staurosira complex sp., Strain CCMP2646" /LENGTH=362 /DNA_ID=CAMNT_0049136133 /DNA_START=90 /DNA_END=1178 /DNA_ORIENTATION=+
MAAEQMETAKPSPRAKPMSVMRAILGECMCETFPFTDNRGLSQTSQFIELHGVECISLGAVVDELSPEQRIRETLEQLTAEPKRMISIGYLVDEESPKTSQIAVEEATKVTETVDLDVWRKNYPDDKNMSKPVAQTIKHIEARQFGAALASFEKDLEREKANPARNNNKFLAGITCHNMAVVYLFAGQSDKAFSLFEQAVALKRASFGKDHIQVASSLVEIGIQLFSQERFQEAMAVFEESKRIRLKSMPPKHPLVAMVLNNIACCEFLLKNNVASLEAFQEACDIQHDALGSTARADLDLLHAAITLCNFGYMKLGLKEYEEAQAVFEEALLIQQSVLADDNNRAIRDTRSNMEFTNAFHS